MPFLRKGNYMSIYKNFSLYTPDDEERAALSAQGYTFYKDECGGDWYDIQKEFSEDTLKIAYAADGRIDSASFDVTALVPVGLSVAEIEKDTIPDGFWDGGRWVFDGTNIVAYQLTPNEVIAAAGATKSSLMAVANEAITPLQDAVDLEIATDNEIVLLAEWKRYRVLLNRVDVTAAPNITWPELPDDVA
jgi:hypothetical protein